MHRLVRAFRRRENFGAFHVALASAPVLPSDTNGVRSADRRWGMDRKRWGGFVAIALVSALSTSPSTAAAGQVRRGFALVPTPGRVAGIWVEPCPGAVVEGTLQWAARRSLHPHFPVNSSTWGKSFTLKSMHPAADLDVSFRKGSTWIRFDSRHLGGEHGLVPAGAVEAVVCLALGAPTVFTYRAGVGA